MKAEAIKRGVRYDSDYSVDDADEHVEMTTIAAETNDAAGTASRAELDGDEPSIDRRSGSGDEEEADN